MPLIRSLSLSLLAALLSTASAVAAPPIGGLNVQLTSNGADETEVEVASDPGRENYLVVYVRATDVYFKVVDSGGGTLTGPTLLSQGGSNSRSPSAAFNATDDEYVVAWENDGGGSYDVYARTIDAAAYTLSSTAAVSTTDAGSQAKSHVRVAWDSANNRYGFVWLHDADADLYGQILDNDLATRPGSDPDGDPNNADKLLDSEAVVAGGCDIVYDSADDAYLVLFNYAGPGPKTTLGKDWLGSDRDESDAGFFNPGGPGPVFLGLRAAYDSTADEFLAVYERDDLGVVRGIRLDVTAGGSVGEIGVEFQILPGGPTLPDVAYDAVENVYLVVAEKGGAIKGQYVDGGTDTPSGGELSISNASAVTPDRPAITDNATAGKNNWLVAWQDGRDGNDNAYGNLFLSGFNLTAGVDVTPATVVEGDTDVPFLRVKVETGGVPTLTGIDVYLTTTDSNLFDSFDRIAAYVSTDATFDPLGDLLFDDETSLPGVSTATIGLTGVYAGPADATYYIFLVADLDSTSGGDSVTVEQDGSAGEADDAYTTASSTTSTVPAGTHYSVGETIASLGLPEFIIEAIADDGQNNTPGQGDTDVLLLALLVRGRGTPTLDDVTLDFSGSTAPGADIDNVRIYRSADAVLDGGDVLFDTKAVPGGGDITLNRLGGYSDGTNLYHLLVTIDVNPAAGTGNVVQVKFDSLGDFTIRAPGTKSSSIGFPIASAAVAIPAILRVPSAFPTIQNAVDAVPGVPTAPYIIELENAFYSERVQITGKSGTATNTIRFRTSGDFFATVQHNGGGASQGTFEITGSDFVILAEMAVTGSRGPGVIIDSSSTNITLRNLVVHDNTNEELLVQGADDVVVENVTFHDDDGSETIHVSSSPTNPMKVKNCIFRLEGGASARFWRLNSVSDIGGVDYNWYYNTSSNPTPFRIGGPTSNFIDWQLNTGQESNSTDGTDPRFVNEGARDYHLRSETGSFPNGGDGAFDPDPVAEHSPAIDGGDPTSAFGKEPIDRGIAINLGAFGNTSQAAKARSFADDRWTAAGGTSSWDDHRNWAHGRPDATDASTFNDAAAILVSAVDPAFDASAATTTLTSLSVSAGATLDMNTAGKILIVTGGATIAGTLQQSGAATLRVAGSWDDSSGTFDGTTAVGTVEFDGAGAQVLRTAAANSFFNLTVSGPDVRTDPATAVTLRVAGALSVAGGGLLRISTADGLDLLRDSPGFPPQVHPIAGTLAIVHGDGVTPTTVRFGNHQQLVVSGTLRTEVGAGPPTFPGNRFAHFTRLAPGDGYSVHVSGILEIEFVRFDYLYGRSSNSDEFTQATVESGLAVSGGLASLVRFRVCYFDNVLDGGAPPSGRSPRILYVLGDTDGDGVIDVPATNNNSFHGAGSLLVLHKLRLEGTLPGLHNIEKRAPGDTISVINGTGAVHGDPLDMDGDGGAGDTGLNDILFGSNPTAVDLVELAADGHDGAVALRWRTGAEVDNLGFKVFRSRFPDRSWVEVSTGLVLGLGDSASGGTYRFVDRTVANGLRYYYRLEDIDVRGERTLHGPVSATPSADGGAVPTAPVDLTASAEVGPDDVPDTVVTPSLTDAPEATGAGRPSVAEALIGIDLAAAGIRLLSYDDGGALLEILPPAPAFVPLADGRRIVHTVEMPGYASSRSAGHPEMPSKTVLLATPAIERATYRIVEADSRDVGPIVLERPPAGGRSPAGPPEELLLDDPSLDAVLGSARRDLTRRIRERREQLLRMRDEARRRLLGEDVDEPIAGPGDGGRSGRSVEPAAAGWFPGSTIDLGGLAVVGDRRFVPITIHPVRARGSEVVVDRRLLVRIDFHGLSPEEAVDPDRLDTPEQLALAGDGEALKVEVAADGLYAIDRAALVGAGFDVAVDPRSIRMFHLGREIPIHVEGEIDGHLDPGDRVVFYGTRNPWRTIGNPEATRHTDRNVYWLAAGRPGGRRMEVRWSGPDGARTAVDGPAARHVETDDLYFPRLAGGEGEDLWFDARRLYNTAGGSHAWSRRTWSVEADGLSDRAHVARLTFRLAGVTDLADGDDHRVVVSVGGQVVAEVVFDGRASHVGAAEFPSSLLVDGPNEIELHLPADLPGVAFDMVLVDHFRLEYRRRIEGADGRAAFELEESGSVLVAGFGGDALVVDRSDPSRPVLVRGHDIAGGRLAMAGPAGRYLAVESARLARPDAIRANRPSSWHAAAGADWVAIAHASLADAVGRLADHRAAGGLVPALVDIEDLYDEFTAGIEDPEAIRAFLGHARRRWPRPARYVLLVGDGTSDPHHHASDAPDLVPVRMVETEVVWAASDSWYAAVVGDDLLPDVAIGRLPVRTPDQVAAIVDKIVADETGDARAAWRRRAVLVADDPDAAGDFEAASETLAGTYPAGWSIERIYLSGLGPAATRDRIRTAWSAGARVVNYQGHGSVETWASEGILGPADLDGLDPSDRLPIVTAMDCMNALFQRPVGECLGERALLAPGRGALAFWGSTGLSAPGPQEWINEEFTRLAFGDDGPGRLGDAIQEALVRGHGGSASDDVVRTWVLLGDPATRLP